MALSFPFAPAAECSRLTQSGCARLTRQRIAMRIRRVGNVHVFRPHPPPTWPPPSSHHPVAAPCSTHLERGRARGLGGVRGVSPHEAAAAEVGDLELPAAGHQHVLGLGASAAEARVVCVSYEGRGRVT